jgi:hypothetical protein
MAWNIQREFATVDLGDERRDRRLRLLAARLAATPAASVSASCQGWAETMAGYRLVGSAAVTFEKVLAPHREAAIERARLSEEDLLFIQDTTEFDFTAHKTMEGLGPLDCLQRRGFFLHNHVLMTEQSAVVLGACGGQLLTRLDGEHGKAKTRKQRPIEEKESMRWLRGYAEACAIAARLPDQRVLMIADREADIFELFVEHHQLGAAQAPRAELLIRAKYDRALAEGALFEIGQSAPLLGTLTVDIQEQVQRKRTPVGPRPSLRQARQASLEVRVTRVKLPAPFRRGHTLPDIEMTLITATEQNPPAGQSPICWRLFTTLWAHSLEAATRILQAYTRRWRVEELHRVLKTGCRVESLSFSSAAATQTLIALYVVIAWRILYLRDLSRALPNLPGSDFFSEREWKSACLFTKRKAEHSPPLGELTRVVAIFGGYLARKSDPAPGAECLWRGLSKLHQYVEMAAALGAVG